MSMLQALALARRGTSDSWSNHEVAIYQLVFDIDNLERARRVLCRRKRQNLVEKVRLCVCVISYIYIAYIYMHACILVS